MTDYYLSSVDGNDVDSGLTWALARATLASAFSLMVEGDRLFIDSAHVEGSGTAISPSTDTSLAPSEIYSVDRTGSPEPPDETDHLSGAEFTHGTPTQIDGHMFMKDVVHKSAAGSSGSAFVAFGNINQSITILENCTFDTLVTTTSAERIRIGGGNRFDVMLGWVIVRNCLWLQDQANQQFALSAGNVHIINLIIDDNSSGIWPATLFTIDVSNDTHMLLANIKDCDFSSSVGSELIDIAARGPRKVFFSNIALASGAAITTGTISGHGHAEIICRAVGAGDIPEAFDIFIFEGSIHSETTIVLAGDTFIDGSTGLSMEMVSLSGAAFLTPLALQEASFAVVVDTIGSVTITMEIVTDNVTLNDQEMWFEFEYLSNTGDLVGTIDASSKNASSLDTSPTNLTSSSASWTTTGLTTPVKQKVTKTFTVNQPSIVRITPYLGKASTTVYIAQPAVT